MSFTALLLMGEQIRAGRAFLRLEQAELAVAAIAQATAVLAARRGTPGAG